MPLAHAVTIRRTLRDAGMNLCIAEMALDALDVLTQFVSINLNGGSLAA
jgi:hypothetical protein